MEVLKYIILCCFSQHVRHNTDLISDFPLFSSWDIITTFNVVYVIISPLIVKSTLFSYTYISPFKLKWYYHVSPMTHWNSDSSPNCQNFKSGVLVVNCNVKFWCNLNFETVLVTNFSRYYLKFIVTFFIYKCHIMKEFLLFWGWIVVCHPFSAFL